MSRRLKLIVAYDGSQFAGWQSQSHRNTIQDHIERAFERVGDKRVRVHGAGRTDAGVHALAQCAHVDLATNNLSAARWSNALPINYWWQDRHGRIARARELRRRSDQRRGPGRAYRRHARRRARYDPESCCDEIGSAIPQTDFRRTRRSISSVATFLFTAASFQQLPIPGADRDIPAKSFAPLLDRHSRGSRAFSFLLRATPGWPLPSSAVHPT